MALDFSLHLPNAGITSVDRHTWVYGLLGIEPRTLCTPVVSPYLLKYTSSLGVGVQKVKLVGLVPNTKLCPRWEREADNQAPVSKDAAECLRDL